MLRFRKNPLFFRVIALLLLLGDLPFFTGFDRMIQAVMAEGENGPEDYLFELQADSAITDLAASQKHSARDLFEWVRTNVRYEIYNGSFKGAAATLSSRSGNDLDQALLLGSLLNASNIPWRLVARQVSMPMENAQNWLGVNNPAAVSQLLQRASVGFSVDRTQSPERLILNKHHWVEVNADYYPLRGVASDDVQVEGSTLPNADPLDSWVALDPSVTYREESSAVDLSQFTGLDPENLLEAFSAGGPEIDLSYQNLPYKILEMAALNGRKALQGYLKNLTLDIDTATGTSFSLALKKRSGLPSNLPYTVLDNSPAFADSTAIRTYLMSNGLRKTMSIQVSRGGIAIPLFNQSFSVPRLCSSHLSLSFADSANTLSGISDGSSLPINNSTGGHHTLTSKLSFPGFSQAGPDVELGEILWVQIQMGDRTVARIPILAGGRYQLIPVDYLSDETMAKAQDELNETLTCLEGSSASTCNSLEKYLSYAGRTMLHEAHGLHQTALAANGYAVAGEPSMLLVGLEPDVVDGTVRNVSLVAHKITSPEELQPVAARPTEKSMESAARTAGLAWEVGLSNALELLSGQEKARSAGESLATAVESGDKVRTLPKGSTATSVAPVSQAVLATINGPVAPQPLNDLVKSQLRNATLSMSGITAVPAEGWGYWNADAGNGQAVSPDGMGRTAWASLDKLFVYDLVADGASTRYREQIAQALEGTWQLNANLQSLKEGLAASFTVVSSWLKGAGENLDPLAIPASALMLFKTAGYLKLPRVESVSISPEVIRSEVNGVTVTSLPVDSLTYSVVDAEGNNTPLPTDSFSSDNHGVRYSLVKSVSLADGDYQLSASAHLAAGAASSPEFASFTVDNTAPGLTLILPAGSVEGKAPVRGSIDDLHLKSWLLEGKPQGAGTWDTISSGTTALPMECQIGNVDTHALDWRGSVDVRLTAVDVVGNSNTTTRTMTCGNDITAPLITLKSGAVDYADGNSLALVSDITANFSDNSPDQASNKGLKSAKVYLQSESAPGRAPVVLFDKKQYAGGVFTDSQTLQHDSRKLNQTIEGETWKLVGEAVDLAGNKGIREVRNLKFQDALWSFTVTPLSFTLGGELSGPSVVESLGGVGGGSNHCNITGSFNESCPWTLSVKNLEMNAVIKELGTGTGTKARAEWDGKANSGEFVTPGAYRIVLRYTQGGIEKEANRLVTALPKGDVTYNPWIKEIKSFQSEADQTTWSSQVLFNSPDEPTSGSSFVASDKWPIMAIKGKVPTELLTFLQGSPDDEAVFPPQYPGPASWYLAFKSSSAKPQKADIDAEPQAYATDWNDWHLIKSGYNYPPNGIAEAMLNTSSLPAGYYDVRLWVTDGLQVNSRIVFNLKVTHGDEGGAGTESGGGNTIGALTLSATDMTVPFDGGPVTVSRSYNSSDIYNPGPLGYGWSMNGIGLEIEHTGNASGEFDEAYIKLPDGRKFYFATDRKATAGGAYSRWAKFGEYVNRPYGMKLFRPGGSELYHTPDNGYNQFQQDSVKLEPGSTEYMKLQWQSYAPGKVAYLQTEDKTWYIFEWKSGDLIEVLKPDGQIVKYNRTGTGEINVTDSFGHSMRVVRNAETGRIERIYDSNNKYVEYSYDSYNNLTTVRDRSGRKRFYFYDTKETKDRFPERKGLTGQHPHYLVDVRVDDDLSPEYRVSRFKEDTVAPDSALDTPDGYLATQEWPGDISVFKSETNPDGSMKGIETYGGTVSTEHQKNVDGSGREIVTGPTGVAAQVAYDNKQRMTEQVDFWGGKTTYNYDDVAGANKVTGALESEVNALNQQTHYTYATMPEPAHKNFAAMFQAYVNHQVGDDSAQPGYLTSAQSLPNEIRLDATGQNSVTTISYNMTPGSASQFQPLSFGAPGGTGGNLIYNESGKLSKVGVLDETGTTASLTENEYFPSGGPAWKTGLLSKTTVYSSPSDTTGRSTDYDYAQQGTNLVQVTTDTVSGLGTISVTDASGNMVSSINSRGDKVTAGTDGEGRVVEAYDEQGNRVVSFYNVLGQKVLERLVHVYETGVAPTVILTRTTYEGGRVTKVVRETDKGRVLSVNESSYEQTSWGRIETTSGTGGLASRSYYDGGGRLTKSEQVDAYGRVMTWSASTYDVLGRKVADTRSEGAVTSQTYDSLGRVTKTETKAPGADMVSETGYDEAGRVAWVSQPNDEGLSLYTLSNYDDLGRLVQTFYNSTSTTLVGTGITSTVVTYDDLGRRQYVYNEEGIATKYEYDAQGRVDRTWLGVVPLAGIAGLEYQTQYDNFGNVTSITDPMKRERIKRYDNKGRLWREYSAQGNNTTDLGTNRQVVEYSYYAGGQLKEKKQGVAAGVNGTHAFSRSTIYEYDPATGQMLKETASQDGQVKLVTTRQYEAVTGRFSREEVRNGESAILHWKSYTYDPRTGNQATVTSPEGSIKYGYHQDGKLASISTGTGQSNNYTYDALGRVTRIQSTVLGPQGEPKAVTYEYSPTTGQKKKTNYPNGAWEGRSYDKRGWLVQTFLDLPTDSHGVPDSTETTYIRDRRGLITWTGQVSQSGAGDQTVFWDYTYDSLGRLTEAIMDDAALPTITYRYGYDAASNKITDEKLYKTETEYLKTYSFNALGQCYHEFNLWAGNESPRDYNFDIYGNQKYDYTPYESNPVFAQTVDLNWDVKDRLVKLEWGEEGSVKAMNFTYDAEGQRIRRQMQQETNPPSTTNYLTDSQNPSGYSQTIEESDRAGVPTTGYTWGSEGALAQRQGIGGLMDGAIAQSALGSPYYFHTDNVGSVRLLTGSDGAAPSGSLFNYEPFGKAMDSDSVSAWAEHGLTSLQFTGQYAEHEVGLQYHRARWLSTQRGSWLSADPIYDFPGNFGNGYGYAGQNPGNKNDPLGTFGEGISGAVAVSAALGALTSVALDSYLNGFNGIGHALEVAVIGGGLGALGGLIAGGGIAILIAAGMTTAEASLFIATITAPINVAFAASAKAELDDTERGRQVGTALMVLALLAPFVKNFGFINSIPFKPSHKPAVLSEAQTVKNSFVGWRYSQFPNDRRLTSNGVLDETHWSLIPPWQAKDSASIWRRLDLPGDNNDSPHINVYRRVFKKGETIKSGVVPKGKYRAGHGGIDSEILNVNLVTDWEYWGTIPK